MEEMICDWDLILVWHCPICKTQHEDEVSIEDIKRFGMIELSCCGEEFNFKRK